MDRRVGDLTTFFYRRTAARGWVTYGQILTDYQKKGGNDIFLWNFYDVTVTGQP